MGRGKGKLGQSEREALDICTLPNVRYIASGKQPHSTGRSARCFVTTWRGAREGDARGKRYGNICICITDSLCYKAETNTPL